MGKKDREKGGGSQPPPQPFPFINFLFWAKLWVNYGQARTPERMQASYAVAAVSFPSSTRVPAMFTAVTAAGSMG